METNTTTTAYVITDTTYRYTDTYDVREETLQFVVDMILSQIAHSVSD